MGRYHCEHHTCEELNIDHTDRLSQYYKTCVILSFLFTLQVLKIVSKSASSSCQIGCSFKYYQRMRKHRKNPEVKSDLGYYHGQYNGGFAKPASDVGQRHRRPLQQGHDGFDQWERYSQRSVGDGYASDLEAFSYGGMRW